jgi:hypothetical protein
MLEPHQRAQWLTNNPGVTWQHFVRSRFIGPSPERRGATLGVVVQNATQESEIHAELRGLLELSTSQSLPIVHEFVASIDLVTRDLSIEGSNGSFYSGQFSENGRVLTLRTQLPGGGTSRPFHLVHEATLAHFTSGGALPELGYR